MNPTFTDTDSTAAAGVAGYADPRFEPVRARFTDFLNTGDEIGASIAVDIDGEMVVDLWGGHLDRTHQDPWREDTIVNVWSSTKTVSSLAILLLHERGLLDVFAPVARYWPEFAENGKELIEVRHVLAHTSGIPGWDQPVSIEDLYDTGEAARRLAAQAPWWEPGTASGYHVLSHGALIGELVRRVTGISLTEFVRTELSEPLDADFQIGVRQQDDPRVAEIIPAPPYDFELGDPDMSSIMMRALTGPATDAEMANTQAWRRAELGAANGHGNARALTRIMSPIARGGTVAGRSYLSGETIDLIFREQANGMDLVLPLPLRFGIGFALPHPESTPYLPTDGVCFWGGKGGSLVVMDVKRRTTISYVMNALDNDIIGSPRAAAYLSAIYEALA
ncbi:EstA family serine hydrolase [Microbacterium yannicii]|uniref:EstA family serine hydrolase n=1 Tax=Microbacterium yannicii TaxID=671622 RepID=A0ABP9LYS3_9MICO|nr:serine hydrolase domain-containing protein [Microbacterium yannicii]MCO5954446.1 beta-lactamase family protein [Microbacterium yannicii]